LREDFQHAVYDAWSDVRTLQTEQHANGMSKELMQVVNALKTDDITMDEYQSHVANARLVLDGMLESDKDLHNETSLLNAMTQLKAIDDPDAINVAVRETKIQLQNILVTEESLDALKQLYATFNLYLEDRMQAIPLFEQHIQNFSHIVIELGAVDDDPKPLREALLMATDCINREVPPFEIENLLDAVIRSTVMDKNSAPRSDDLNALVETVRAIIENDFGTNRVEMALDGVLKIQEGKRKVKEHMEAHRKRLAYRQRMLVKKDATENIELRKAELTGAEWDGFRVEDVQLKTKVEENLSPCRQAFKAFDIDGDSVITIDEVIEYLLSVKPDARPNGLKDINPFQKTKMRKRLAGMDTDGDGKLSFEEFEAWWMNNNGE